MRPQTANGSLTSAVTEVTAAATETAAGATATKAAPTGEPTGASTTHAAEAAHRAGTVGVVVIVISSGGLNSARAERAVAGTA